MLNDSDMINSATGFGQHRDLILIDGQLANNKKPMQNTELELMLLKTPGALRMCNSNGGSGNISLGNNINTTMLTNNNSSAQNCINNNSRRHAQDSVDCSGDLQPEEDPGFHSSNDTMDRMKKLEHESANNNGQAALPSNSELDENVVSISVPSGFGVNQSTPQKGNGTMGSTGSVNASSDKLDTVTADVIISEYPSDCFPEPMYKYCMWCMDETPFWIKWKEIRFRCYQFVEHKYFETLVITLILISSMALVCQ